MCYIWFLLCFTCWRPGQWFCHEEFVVSEEQPLILPCPGFHRIIYTYPALCSPFSPLRFMGSIILRVQIVYVEKVLTAGHILSFIYWQLFGVSINCIFYTVNQKCLKLLIFLLRVHSIPKFNSSMVIPYLTRNRIGSKADVYLHNHLATMCLNVGSWRTLM